MDEGMRKIEITKLHNQLKSIAVAVGKHKIEELTFIGFSQIGSINYIDLYYAADTPSGPVIFRASVFAPGNKHHLTHEFAVFEGWKQARQAVTQIQHRAGKTTLEIIYEKEKKKKGEKEADKNRPIDVSAYFFAVFSTFQPLTVYSPFTPHVNSSGFSRPWGLPVCLFSNRFSSATLVKRLFSTTAP
jgi:hypothetical protein